MSRSIDWTGEMDALLREMRADGCPVAEIAGVLDISKNAVINRCDRLGLVTGVRFRLQHRDVPQEDREETPLPPGHPASWGAITSANWPALFG